MSVKNINLRHKASRSKMDEKRINDKIKEMKKVYIIAILPLIFLLLYFFLGAFLVPSVYKDTFLGELSYKYEKLKSTKGKRIVLVGGSSVAFGLDSASMEKNLEDYQIINFGMYAGLGTKVMLDLSESQLKKGDIVILSPEQNNQTLSTYFNAAYMWQALDGNAKMLFSLKREEIEALIGELPYYATDKWKFYMQRKEPRGSGVYRRNSFNEYGDIKYGLCEANVMQNGYDSNQMISFQDKMPDSKFIKMINDYTDKLQKRGVTVWYHFPPMNERAVQEQDQIDTYASQLQKKLHCYIIGTPQKSIYEAGWFYDTNFHLNSSGKILNTKAWISDIKVMLGDTSHTNITVPQEPAVVTQDKIAGDNFDANYFTYKKSEKGYMICGLTVKGKQQTKLTIPTSYKGEPIYKISIDTFRGNQKITSITIQKNISSILDKTFFGCSELEYIYMKQEQPQECIIGDHLLDGTKAKICVKKDVISTYKTNYFWSKYADRIIEKE